MVAGPGSGKTTVLIERFRGLVESGVSPLRILAITFTEKATNQMRERLLEAFGGRPELTLQIPRTYVSTVHGFCTRLLRENAIVAGVDPRFRVLNEQEAFALEKRSAVDALDLFLNEKPSEVQNLLRSLHSGRIQGNTILDIYDTMRAAGMALDDLRGFQPRTGARAALDQIALEIRRIERLAGRSASFSTGAAVNLSGQADFLPLADFETLISSKIPVKERLPIKRIREDLDPGSASR